MATTVVSIASRFRLVQSHHLCVTALEAHRYNCHLFLVCMLAMSSPGECTFQSAECAMDENGIPSLEFDVSPGGRKTPLHTNENAYHHDFEPIPDTHIVDAQSDEEDPFLDDESDYEDEATGDNGRDHASRKASENSFSTMPDELPVHDSFAAASTEQTSAHSATSPWRKSARPSDYTRLISPSQQRLMSSRESSRGTPLSPLAHNRVASGSPGSPFTPSRNNSRASKQIQVSSPQQPFSQSPRSARIRKREGTPKNFLSTPTRSVTQESVARRIPSYANAQPAAGSATVPHPNPKKEYPLVLLHCTINLLSPPYGEHLLSTYLPLSTQENLAMLREKLSATVLDRGILLPHPGDDYEVLEERVLESLELKIPRVGRCGHFLGSGTTTPRNEMETDGCIEADNSSSGETVQGEPKDDRAAGGVSVDSKACADCSCSTCGAHISSSINGSQRRWDIRVYAANGLMRSGAWGAAWREMENVDIEIGVWIPDEVRHVLETEAIKEAERWEVSVVERYQDKSQVEDIDNSLLEDERETPLPRADQTVRRPLSDLLASYIKRTLLQRPEILLHVFIAVLGVIYLLRSPVKPNVAPVPSQDYETTASTSVVTTTISIAATQSATTYFETVSPVNMPACTFLPGEEEQHGMTALSKSVASRILEAEPEMTRVANIESATGSVDLDIPSDDA